MYKTRQFGSTLHEANLKQYLTGIVRLTDKLILDIDLDREHRHGDYLYLKQQVLEVVVPTQKQLFSNVTYTADECGYSR